MSLLDRIARSRGNPERTLMALHFLRLKNGDKKPKLGEQPPYLEAALANGSLWARLHQAEPARKTLSAADEIASRPIAAQATYQ